MLWLCRPLAPHAAVLVAARDDAYVAVQSTEAIAARWRGSQLWHAEGGHVSSFLLLNPLYLKAVTQALQRLDEGPPQSAQQLHVSDAAVGMHAPSAPPGAGVGAAHGDQPARVRGQTAGRGA